jgi:D-glycero-alpha-D-manno-heptose-7-phosphate kinase
MNLTNILEKTEKTDKNPSIIAYNRIDGPGSSLDLREWQMSLWNACYLKEINGNDKSMYWSRYLPRTVGITIDIGTLIEAHPIEKGKIGVESVDYKSKHIHEKGKIPPIKEYWLNKIIELFGIDGVLFKLQNLNPELKSAGLGGSATATIGVAILANELSGRVFNKEQIVGMSSMIEQDFGVSITGTQEQSNVIFGGVTDYLWFPWGKPGNEGFYGSSIRTPLLDKKQYPELEDRIAIYFLGERSSVDVNSEWRRKLQTEQGFKLHSKKPELAYNFREAIRNQDWQAAKQAIKAYQEIRTELCSDYMNGTKEIENICQRYGAVSFPLGAGGGGSIMIFSPEKQKLKKLKKQEEISKNLEIEYKILERGHELRNIDFFNSLIKEK